MIKSNRKKNLNGMKSYKKTIFKMISNKINSNKNNENQI